MLHSRTYHLPTQDSRGQCEHDEFLRPCLTGGVLVKCIYLSIHNNLHLSSQAPGVLQHAQWPNLESFKLIRSHGRGHNTLPSIYLYSQAQPEAIRSRYLHTTSLRIRSTS